MAAALKRFWAKRPLFGIAIILVAILAVEAFAPQWIFAGIFAGALLPLLLKYWRVSLVVAALGVFLIVSLRWRDSRQAEDEKRFAILGLRNVEGRVIEDGFGENGKWSATVRLHGAELGGRKIRWSGTGETPPAGTEMKARGTFSALEIPRNPGSPDRSQRLRNEGVVANFRASQVYSKRWISAFSASTARFKKGFRESIVAGLDEENIPAKVIRAVTLGERSRDSLDLVRSFRESGTLHVFTVSGLHVAMVGGIIWLILKWMGIPRRQAIPLIIAVMFGYVWLTGSGPAAVRAAWMGAVFLTAFALRRRTDLLNALGAVLLLSLIWDPRMIRMPGVQLSYGVVAAIGLGTMFARRCFEWIAEEETFLPKSEMGWWQRKWLHLRQQFATGLAVSLAASVGSTPLSMFHFGIVTPVSVIATVILVMQVWLLLVLALLSAALHPLSEKASVFVNQGNALVATICAGTADLFSKIPGAWVETRFPSQESLVIYDLDYGAAAACFASTTRNAVMIDAGGSFSLEREIGPSLRQLGMNPDAFIFTHQDAGHTADERLLTAMFPIHQVAQGMPEPLKAWSKGIETRTPHRGDILDFGGGAQAEILLSPHDKILGSVSDDRVMVFRMDWHGRKILWFSDAGRLSEQALLDSGIDLKADVIIAGFHESDLSLTDEFIAAVAPQAIVIPRPPGSVVDLYRTAQIVRWRKAGLTIIDQLRTGGLTVTIAGNGDLLFNGYLDESKAIVPCR